MGPDDLVELLRRDSQRLDRRISDLGVHLRARIDDTNKRTDQINTRIGHLAGHLGERIDVANARLNTVDRPNDQIDTRFDQIDAHFDRIDRRFDEFASSVCAFEQRLFDHLQSMQTELGRRIDAVQTELGGRIDVMQTEFGRRIDAAQQFRLQGLALVVAPTATSAIVGTFALQLLAAL